MGRAYRIRKRTCHITVVVEGEPKAEMSRPSPVKAKAGQPAKEEPKKALKVKAAAEKPSVEEKKKVETKVKKTKKAKE